MRRAQPLPPHLGSIFFHPSRANNKKKEETKKNICSLSDSDYIRSRIVYCAEWDNVRDSQWTVNVANPLRV